MELSVTLENFAKCKELVIPPGTLDYKVRMCLYDASNFVLELQVHIKARPGGSLRVRQVWFASLCPEKVQCSWFHFIHFL